MQSKSVKFGNPELINSQSTEILYTIDLLYTGTEVLRIFLSVSCVYSVNEAIHTLRDTVIPT